MNKGDQIRIVRQLSRAVTLKVVLDIQTGNVPEGWDGHELRKLLADRFTAEITNAMSGKRLADYRNTIATTTL